MRVLHLLPVAALLVVPAFAQQAPVGSADAPTAPTAEPAAHSGAAAPVASAAPAPGQGATAQPGGLKGQQMICRTDRETGSLAKSKKRCYTAEQWTQIENKHRENGRQIQERNAGIYNPP